LCQFGTKRLIFVFTPEVCKKERKKGKENCTKMCKFVYLCWPVLWPKNTKNIFKKEKEKNGATRQMCKKL